MCENDARGTPVALRARDEGRPHRSEGSPSTRTRNARAHRRLPRALLATRRRCGRLHRGGCGAEPRPALVREAHRRRGDPARRSRAPLALLRRHDRRPAARGPRAGCAEVRCGEDRSAGDARPARRAVPAPARDAVRVLREAEARRSREPRPQRRPGHWRRGERDARRHPAEHDRPALDDGVRDRARLAPRDPRGRFPSALHRAGAACGPAEEGAQAARAGGNERADRHAPRRCQSRERCW